MLQKKGREVSLLISLLLLHSPTFLENLPPLSPGFLTFYGYSSFLPDFSETSRLPHSSLPSPLGRFLPFMSLTFPTPLNSSILWPLSSFFCCFAFLFFLSDISYFIFLLSLLFLYDILNPVSSLFTIIGRAFPFRKLFQLLLL